VTGCIAQIYEAALGQQQQVVIAGAIAIDFVHLRLDLLPLPVLPHICSIDFIVEVADVAHDRATLEGFEHGGITHVEVARRRDEQVGSRQ